MNALRGGSDLHLIVARIGLGIAQPLQRNVALLRGGNHPFVSSEVHQLRFRGLEIFAGFRNLLLKKIGFSGRAVQPRVPLAGTPRQDTQAPWRTARDWRSRTLP